MCKLEFAHQSNSNSKPDCWSHKAASFAFHLLPPSSADEKRSTSQRNRPDELKMNPVLCTNPRELSIACISHWTVFLCLRLTNYMHMRKNKVICKLKTSVCGGAKIVMFIGYVFVM